MEPDGSLPHSQVPATCPYPERVSVTVRGLLYECFVTWYPLRWGVVSSSPNPPSWRTTNCRLSATAYPIHSQLPSTLEAVPPSPTWGRAMPRWQEPTYHIITRPNLILRRLWFMWRLIKLKVRPRAYSLLHLHHSLLFTAQICNYCRIRIFVHPVRIFQRKMDSVSTRK